MLHTCVRLIRRGKTFNELLVFTYAFIKAEAIPFLRADGLTMTKEIKS